MTLATAIAVNSMGVRAGLAVVDAGRTLSVAGRTWDDAMNSELPEVGLRAGSRPHREVFRGLGGARRENHDMCIMPIGVLAVSDVVEVACIEGGMIALLSRNQLAHWGTRRISGAKRFEFTELGHLGCSDCSQSEWACAA